MMNIIISNWKAIIKQFCSPFPAVERMSENIHISANEPSLAVYRLQEHVRRACPPMVSRRQHVLTLNTQLQGACYDVEYALG